MKKIIKFLPYLAVFTFSFFSLPAASTARLILDTSRALYPEACQNGVIDSNTQQAGCNVWDADSNLTFNGDMNLATFYSAITMNPYHTPPSPLINQSNTIRYTGNITGGRGSGYLIGMQGVSNNLTITGNVTSQSTGVVQISGGLAQRLPNQLHYQKSFLTLFNTLTINGNLLLQNTGGYGQVIVLQSTSNNTVVVTGSVISTSGGAGVVFTGVDLGGIYTPNPGSTSGNTVTVGSITSTNTYFGAVGFDKYANNNTLNSNGDITGLIHNDGTGNVVNNGTNKITNVINRGTLTISGTHPDGVESWQTRGNYGAINFTGSTQAAAGPTTFIPHAGSSNRAVHLTTGTHTGVLNGISDANLHSTRTGTLTGNGTSSAGSANWTLSESASGSQSWNLGVTGSYHYFGSVPQLQSSIQETANNMRGAFNSITGSMNFANMTTYDCDLFGGNGGCVSVGGRYTGTDNPDTSASAIVAKAGYKFNEHFRYGAFVDQTFNSKSHHVDMDMNTPMVGLMGVWNQNPDQLGMQMKLANTYQKTDATITRNAPISGDDYKGDTNINAQSYVAELSWRHLNNQKDTLLQPFVATRYAIIDQDGYNDDIVTYGSIEQKTLTALGGVKAKHQLNPKMTLTGSIGVEHDLNEDTDDLSVSVSGVSGLTAASMTSGGQDKTRLLGSVGAQYYLTKDQRIEAKFMYEQLRYNDANYKTAYVNYTIGF